MHIRCPHCRNPIELVDDGSLDNVNCPSCGSSFSLVADDDTKTFQSETVRTIGHFELREQVGMGAFGSVWKAYGPELDRFVAIKIPGNGHLDEAASEKFFREARAAAQRKHPALFHATTGATFSDCRIHRLTIDPATEEFVNAPYADVLRSRPARLWSI